MSQLDPIVNVVIDVQTDTVARTSFGIPAVMAGFSAAKATLTFSGAFIADNVISGSAGGSAYSVTYATSDSATFTALVAALEGLTGVSATGDLATRTITLELPTAALTCAVTLGVSRPTVAVSVKRDIQRAKSYASLSELALDGWLTTDSVYKACAAVFSQNPRPSTVVVGRRDTADTDWATALNAILAVNDAWYFFGIVPLADMDAEVLQAAAWAESAESSKIFFAQTGDTDVLTSASDDAMSVLQDLGYKRTAVMYRPAAKALEFTELGWVGEGAPYAPGSSAWAFKSVAGSTPDTLTSAQKSAALSKNANVYTTVAGVNITQAGKVAAGEWIDVIHGIDALTAELQETVYAALTANRKLDFDDGGITAVGGLLQGVLEKYGRQGVLQLDSIVLNMPRYADLPVADRNTRKLSGITFSALLQGAIYLVEIRGTVSN